MNSARKAAKALGITGCLLSGMAAQAQPPETLVYPPHQAWQNGAFVVGAQVFPFAAASLRAQPAFKAPVVAKLPAGAWNVVVRERCRGKGKEGWYRVLYGTSATGFVYQDALARTALVRDLNSDGKNERLLVAQSGKGSTAVFRASLWDGATGKVSPPVVFGAVRRAGAGSDSNSSLSIVSWGSRGFGNTIKFIGVHFGDARGPGATGDAVLVYDEGGLFYGVSARGQIGVDYKFIFPTDWHEGRAGEVTLSRKLPKARQTFRWNGKQLVAQAG